MKFSGASFSRKIRRKINCRSATVFERTGRPRSICLCGRDARQWCGSVRGAVCGALVGREVECRALIGRRWPPQWGGPSLRARRTRSCEPGSAFKWAHLRHLRLLNHMRIFCEKDAQENFMHFSRKFRQKFAKKFLENFAQISRKINCRTAPISARTGEQAQEGA